MWMQATGCPLGLLAQPSRVQQAGSANELWARHIPAGNSTPVFLLAAAYTIFTDSANELWACHIPACNSVPVSLLAAAYTYLIGSANELWTRHIPYIPARNDTLAGPYGRHADQVSELLPCRAAGWLVCASPIHALNNCVCTHVYMCVYVCVGSNFAVLADEAKARGPAFSCKCIWNKSHTSVDAFYMQ
eukprot:1157242-Pelagomonas_calceolata.AAC.4